MIELTVMQGDLPFYLHRQLRHRVEDLELRALQKGLESVLEFELTTLRLETERALEAGCAGEADAVLVMMERLRERIAALPAKDLSVAGKLTLSRPRP